MNLSNRYLLVIVASAVAINSVLATLIIHQQHDYSTQTGQVSPSIAPPVLAPSIPAPVSAPPQLAPGSQVAIPLARPLVASTPPSITPPQQPPATHTPRKLLHRRVNPVPASPPVPAPPPPTPARSDTAAKPGAPPELS